MQIEAHDLCADMSCSEAPTYMVGVYKAEEHGYDANHHWHSCPYHLGDVVSLVVDDGHIALVEKQHGD